MANIKFTNFARSTLAIGAASGATSLTLAPTTGSRFPALGAGEYFYLTLENASLVREIVKVTARAGDVLTVVRAQDNTTAQTWNAGDVASLRFNAAAIEESVLGTVSFEQLFSQGLSADVAAATTVDIGAQLSTLINVTGTGTITSFGTNYNGPRFIRFAGVCTLTNGASLVIPGGANITTAAGDSAIAVPLGNPATGWRVAGYQKADGTAIVGTTGPITATSLTMSTNRILGRTAAGTGAIGELTGAQAAALIPARIQPISASVAANALTISASALTLDFRSTTLGSGTVTTVSGTPANLVISSGSTLGTINATQSRIVVLAINNAGTIELAAVNIAGGNQLDETNLISTTAEGGAGAADSANVIYSTTARASVSYRVIGYIESTQATAGTWATAPSTIQGAGGNALTSMQSLGYGQTWQNVFGSRSASVTYYNTTGRPICVFVRCANTGGATLTVNGVVCAFAGPITASTEDGLSAIVPTGGSYVFNGTISTNWSELR